MHVSSGGGVGRFLNDYCDMPGRVLTYECSGEDGGAVDLDEWAGETDSESETAAAQGDACRGGGSGRGSRRAAGFASAKVALRELVGRGGSPRFEFRCTAPSSTAPWQGSRATFEGCFSDDGEWIVDLATNSRFRGPMAWGMDCRRRAGCKQVRGISVKKSIYYRGQSLAQHERAASTAAAAVAAAAAATDSLLQANGSVVADKACEVGERHSPSGDQRCVRAAYKNFAMMRRLT